MSKRTNEIYNVHVALFLWMPVEASSPQEAMRIARKYVDEYVTDEDFEDSEVEVDACETYPHTIDDYEDEENIFCDDCVMRAEDYYRKYEAQKEK